MDRPKVRWTLTWTAGNGLDARLAWAIADGTTGAIWNGLNAWTLIAWRTSSRAMAARTRCGLDCRPLAARATGPLRIAAIRIRLLDALTAMLVVLLLILRGSDAGND
jgi:hypothetical protein